MPNLKSSSSRRRSDRGRGQALTEFALVIPIFLLLVSGMIDFGLGLNSSITVTNAAREGARLGVTTLSGNANASTTGSTPLGNICARVKSMAGGLDVSQFDSCATRVAASDAALASAIGAGTNISCQQAASTSWTNCASPAPASGDKVQITLRYTYRMFFPLLFGTGLTIGSSASFRIE